MLHARSRYALLAGVALWAGCSGEKGDDGAGNAGTGGTAPAAGSGGMSGMAGLPAGGSGGVCETAIVTTPEKNYEFWSKLTIDFVPVQPKSELTFDWSGATTDLMKHPLSPDQIDMVEITLWEKTVEEFQTQLNNDTVGMPILIGHIPNATTHATSGSIFSMIAPGATLDQATILSKLDPANFPPENHVYAVLLASGDMYGQGTHMLGGFKLDPASTNTHVAITSTSTQVDYMAMIASRPPTYIPAGTGAVTIDWTRMKKTAAGEEFIPGSITRFRIGHYTQTPAELEGENFMKLDELAQEMFEAPVDVGTKISFDKAMTTDGKTFSGIDGTGTWIVALNCGGCQNPAPWYLSVLVPCPASP